jgi:hypothetical protein
MLSVTVTFATIIKMYSRPDIHLYCFLLRRGRKVKSYFLLRFMLGNCKQVNKENTDTVNVIRHSLLHLGVHKPAYYICSKDSGLYNNELCFFITDC